MSEGNGRIWTDREIVLEMFPATPEPLVPRPLQFTVEDEGDGQARVLDREGFVVLRLVPVTPAGNPTGELCCDLCHRSGTRRFLGLYRAEMPGSNGRRFRYLSACRDHQACETRRLDDGALHVLLASDA